MKPNRYLVGAIILIIGILIWRTDTFQREVFPKRYWYKEVKSLEQMIRIEEFTIKDFAIKLQKKQMTAGLDVAQQINTGVLAGMSAEEAREWAIREMRLEIDALTKAIRVSQEVLDRDSKRLRQARRELSKYR